MVFLSVITVFSAIAQAIFLPLTGMASWKKKLLKMLHRRIALDIIHSILVYGKNSHWKCCSFREYHFHIPQYVDSNLFCRTSSRLQCFGWKFRNKPVLLIFPITGYWLIILYVRCRYFIILLIHYLSTLFYFLILHIIWVIYILIYYT